MSSRTLPGLGLTGFWPLGFNGWKDANDINLRLCSALIQSRALNLVAAEPGSPTDGDIYLLNETHGTHPNAIAIRDAGAWVYVTPLTGWEFYDITAGVMRRFNGTTWTSTVDSAIRSYVDSAVAAVSGGGSGGTLDGIVAGCGVAYSGTALTFNMSAGSFYLDGDPISATAQSVTLAAADATNPRIDVLYVDNTGTFGKVTGTAAASPSQPAVDPTTQLSLTFVLVPATATSLSGITTVDIYKEGVEWTWTTSGSGFTVNSTSNPYAGTKDIEGTAVAAAAYAKGVAPAPISFDGDGNLVLRIRSKAAWNSRRWLTLQWFSSGIAKGNAINLKSGTFGFDSALTSAYQLVVIAKSLFSIPAGTSVNELRVTDAGGSIGFYLDDITLQTNGTTTGGTAISGITQDQADARYAQRSANLGDLASPAAARTNLGLLRLISFSVLGSVPTAAEVLGLYPVVDAFTIPANLAGTISSILTNPAATFAIDITRQVAGAGAFTTIATISVSTGGVVTLSTAGGTSKAIAAGDIIKIAGDSDGDTAFIGAFTIKGIQ